MKQTGDHPAQLGAAGALDGITILDCTQMLAGPLAGLRLGDLGADVLLMEAPGAGGFNRTHGFEGMTAAGEMTNFLALTRNKRSVCTTLCTTRDIDAMHDLV